MSISLFRRLFLLMTPGGKGRSGRSWQNAPPSSCTIGRRSGGITGSTVRDHPFRLIARFAESFHFFQPADAADFALVAAAVHIFAELFFQGFQIQLAEKLLNSFRPHLRLKRTGAVFLDGLLVFLFI